MNDEIVEDTLEEKYWQAQWLIDVYHRALVHTQWLEQGD